MIDTISCLDWKTLPLIEKIIITMRKFLKFAMIQKAATQIKLNVTYDSCIFLAHTLCALFFLGGGRNVIISWFNLMNATMNHLKQDGEGWNLKKYTQWADLRGRPRLAPPPHLTAQNVLNFMWCFEFFSKIIGWRPLLEGWRPSYGEFWIRPWY